MTHLLARSMMEESQARFKEREIGLTMQPGGCFKLHPAASRSPCPRRWPQRGSGAIPDIRGEVRRHRTRLLAVVIPLAIAALALALSLPRLTTPPNYVFDELYYAYTAGKYVSRRRGVQHGGATATTIRPSSGPIRQWPSC